MALYNISRELVLINNLIMLVNMDMVTHVPVLVVHLLVNVIGL